ncbi:hypothetical protein MASR1M12_41080 [Erysipelotrichia bacterium]
MCRLPQKTRFDKWLYVLKNLERLHDIPEKLKERIFRKLFAAAEIAKFTPEEAIAYEDSLKVYRDLKNSIDTAREEGEIKGHDAAMANQVWSADITYLPMAKGAVARMDWSSRKGIIMPHSGLIIPEKVAGERALRYTGRANRFCGCAKESDDDKTTQTGPLCKICPAFNHNNSPVQGQSDNDFSTYCQNRSFAIYWLYDLMLREPAQRDIAAENLKTAGFLRCYMLKAELLEIITNGENSGIEFKRDDVRPEQLAKEIVAFANLQGGRILLGVEDGGQISGLQRSNTQEWVLNVFRDKIHPQIIPFYEEIVIEEGLRVGVINVVPGISKPYVVRHNNREEIYIRMGSRSDLASREQQQRLFESGGMLHVEVLPVMGTSLENIDTDRLDYYLRSIIKDPELPATDSEWVERLLGLGLMAKDGMGNAACSVAGLLCFGITPRQFLRQAGLRVMAFSGNDKEYQALLDVVLDAPLVGRWRLTGSGQKQLVDEGLIEKFASTILPFITREASEIDENMRREKSWLYPWEALRETVINAMAHRDWTRTVDIEVTNYSNRLEVISPGRLQNSMTVTKMVADLRSPRNPLIMDILRDYGYVDSRGMGVRTKVIPLMRQLNLTDPIFEATDDYLKTTLPAKELTL